jgi:hypothetical protein
VDWKKVCTDAINAPPMQESQNQKRRHRRHRRFTDSSANTSSSCDANIANFITANSDYTTNNTPGVISRFLQQNLGHLDLVVAWVKHNELRFQRYDHKATRRGLQQFSALRKQGIPVAVFVETEENTSAKMFSLFTGDGAANGHATVRSAANHWLSEQLTDLQTSKQGCSQLQAGLRELHIRIHVNENHEAAEVHWAGLYFDDELSRSDKSMGPSRSGDGSVNSTPSISRRTSLRTSDLEALTQHLTEQEGWIFTPSASSSTASSRRSSRRHSQRGTSRKEGSSYDSVIVDDEPPPSSSSSDLYCSDVCTVDAFAAADIP